MYQNSSSQTVTESKLNRALPCFEQGYQAESEQRILALINKAKTSEDRFFLSQCYGEILTKLERWAEAREVLLGSARIALGENNLLWLAEAHEKLGDLSAAEGNWFGANHHYRYALRNVQRGFDRSVREQLEAKVNYAQQKLHSTILAQDRTILPLSKEYTSGPMAISFVHRDIFLKAYFARCLECRFCHDWCCSFGADIDIRNVHKILQRREEILSFVRPPKGEWFETEYSYYEKYSGSQYTRINPQGPRCAFISKDQRGCGLHRYAISKQLDYHEIKPLVCILFPLSFGEGILTIAPELEDNSLVCAHSGYSVYQSMRRELEYYFGREFVEELDGMEKNVLAQDQESTLKERSQNA